MVRLPRLQRLLRRDPARPRRRPAPPASELGASGARSCGCVSRSSATSAGSRSRCTGATASAKISCSSAARADRARGAHPRARCPPRRRTTRRRASRDGALRVRRTAPVGVALLRHVRPPGRRGRRGGTVTSAGPTTAPAARGGAAGPGVLPRVRRPAGAAAGRAASRVPRRASPSGTSGPAPGSCRRCSGS